MEKSTRVCEWEKGASIPSLEYLLLLYLLYQIPIEELYAEYLEELRPRFITLMNKYRNGGVQ